jgi:formylmethanofuran dehydrogenase subunit E
MKSSVQISLIVCAIFLGVNIKLFAHDETGATNATHSLPGANIWNQAQEPTNWWNEIKQVHGHVGPWNVLGWRMGKAALRELGATWGQHELDVVCHIPLQTPYSCIADGLVVGTGNSLGRLDLRLAEELSATEIHVSVRRKDGTGPVLILKPKAAYLERIRSRPDEELETLARECASLPEEKIFEIWAIPVEP